MPCRNTPLEGKGNMTVFWNMKACCLVLKGIYWENGEWNIIWERICAIAYTCRTLFQNSDDTTRWFLLLHHFVKPLHTSMKVHCIIRHEASQNFWRMQWYLRRAAFRIYAAHVFMIMRCWYSFLDMMTLNTYCSMTWLICLCSTDLTFNKLDKLSKSRKT